MSEIYVEPFSTDSVDLVVQCWGFIQSKEARIKIAHVLIKIQKELDATVSLIFIGVSPISLCRFLSLKFQQSNVMLETQKQSKGYQMFLSLKVRVVLFNLILVYRFCSSIKISFRNAKRQNANSLLDDEG